MVRRSVHSTFWAGAYVVCRRLTVLVAATIGCAPAIDATQLSGPYPPAPPDTEILRYSTKLPECPYVEVALLAGFDIELGSSLDDTLRALEERTRRLGGDAIVSLTRIERGGDPPKSGYTGTAIRFTKEGCRR
jgi:hypothetical protein